MATLVNSLDNEEIDGDCKLFKFVLTGGPCSGKTTAVGRLQDYLSERGYRVFVVPEAATMLFLNGASPNDFGKYPKCGVAFQRFVLRTQVHLEDNIAHYAKATNQNCVLLCDRGLMDGAAYVTQDEFKALLSGENLDIISARDTRYNAILHLVTAADGAEAHYSLDNNLARHETPDEARQKDAATQNAWVGHAHHVIFDNADNKSFEEKMQSLVSTVAGFVGLRPTPRKTHLYKLTELPDMALMPDCRVFNVIKTMLEVDDGAMDADAGGSELGPPDSLFKAAPLRRALSGFSDAHSETGEESGRVLYSFVRKRSSATGDGADAYGLTTVRELPGGDRVETKQVIGKRVYEVLSRSADTTRVVIKQKRYCFLWKRMSFSVIEYMSPKKGLVVLRCQSDGSDEPELPPFLTIGKQVDGEEALISSRHLSLKKHNSDEDLNQVVGF
jgi:predicted ATPase